MVCSNIRGVWNFLRIAFGAVKVKAAFYVLCPTCRGGMRGSEAEIDQIWRKAEKSMPRFIKDIENENQIVKVCTYEMANEYLHYIRPLIEVDHKGWSAHVTGS